MRRFGLLLLLLLLSAPLAVEAQNYNSIIHSGLCDGNLATGRIDADCVLEVALHVIRVVFSLTGAICVIMIMVGGYQWTLGNLIGSKDQAKQTINNAIVGLIASVLSFVIVTFVLNALS
ncbi:MAG TPA: hypothetical protein VI913_04175 [Candidatus Peribacteraceae bacterium]|nr:hypothetical protein [Candidatus Peribacteraceae bacterium]